MKSDMFNAMKNFAEIPSLNFKLTNNTSMQMHYYLKLYAINSGNAICWKTVRTYLRSKYNIKVITFKSLLPTINWEEQTVKKLAPWQKSLRHQVTFQRLWVSCNALVWQLDSIGSYGKIGNPYIYIYIYGVSILPCIYIYIYIHIYACVCVCVRVCDCVDKNSHHLNFLKIQN